MIITREYPNDRIDIVMVSHNRAEITQRCLDYLYDRTTRDSYRLILIENGSKDGTTHRLLNHPAISDFVSLGDNVGIHVAKNYGLMMVRSSFYIDTDNDILVPKYEEGEDWIERMVDLQKRHSDFAAITLRPQVLVGRDESKDDKGEEVIETNHIGGCMRLMNTKLTRDAGGWDWDDNRLRNNEEHWICGGLRKLGKKVGYASNLRCYHIFGKNWGYGEIPKEAHGHRDIWPPPEAYDCEADLDPYTFERITK